MAEIHNFQVKIHLLTSKYTRWFMGPLHYCRRWFPVSLLSKRFI